MIKQDLTWLRDLIENYKFGLRTQLKISSTPNFIETKYKVEAADEILNNIREFIAEANKLQGQ